MLQKSFCITEHKFSELLARRSNNMETEEAKTVTKEEKLLDLKLLDFKRAAFVAVGRQSDLIEHAKHHWQIPLKAEKSPRCDRTAMIRGFSRPILNS